MGLISARSFGALMLTSALVAFGASGARAAFECPVTGGDLVFGQEAKVNSLDMHASSTISTRNIAMHMFEALLTRDEDNNPILELAKAVDVSDDGMVYTFKLRDGIKFHNGKAMTSADVAASFDRYKKVGIESVILGNVASWETPDPATFVINMTAAQPTFLEDLSSFSVPIVIVPAENTSADPLKLEPVGTGPFEFVEFIADSHVKLKRYEGYVPNEAYEDRTGFGGYKQACLDTVTFRIVTEPGARVAGLETGELQAVEDVPQASVERLEQDADIQIVPYENFWIHIATPNFAKRADRQRAGAPGDPDRARHGRDHGGGDRRRLQHQLSASRPRTARSTPMPARSSSTSRTRRRRRRCSRRPATMARSSCCSPTRTTPRCTMPRW